MSKLYFYKCVHFLLFLSLSTVLIHQFHFYTKILTLITLISKPISSHSHPYSLHHHSYSPHPTLISRIPIIPTLIPTHSHPDPHIPTIPTLILRIPIISTLFPRIPIIPLIPFPDSPFRLLQIARSLCFVSEIVSQSCYICINCLIQIWVTNIVNVI